MINKIESKNSFARPSARLNFPEAGVALVAGEAVRKPAPKNLKQTFFETFNGKNPSFNRILGSLSANDFSRLQPHLESVSLPLGESLYQPQDQIRYVYFPESAVISNLQMLEDGRTIEISMVGQEGVAGFSSVFDFESAINWTEVSVAGSALKLNARILKQEFGCGGSLQTALFNYVNSYIEQISRRVVCNNYHQIKGRFCSWLLTIQKRSGKDKFFLTHEQIARFLGVHRPGITNLTSELRKEND